MFNALTIANPCTILQSGAGTQSGRWELWSSLVSIEERGEYQGKGNARCVIDPVCW